MRPSGGMSQSGHIILCALPHTSIMKRMIEKDTFDHDMPNHVFMNVNRGPIVDEDALIDALKRVGATDATETYMHVAADSFSCRRVCPVFLSDFFINPVDQEAVGY